MKNIRPAGRFLIGTAVLSLSTILAFCAPLAEGASPVPNADSVSEDVESQPDPLSGMSPYEALFAMEQEMIEIDELPEYCPDEPVEIPVDFASYQARNPEIYAWITVEDTPINYPVAQHEGEDQTYYLHRNEFGQEEFAGCIYTEVPNKKNFTSLLTVMYGHNMRNGSMFRGVHYFEDKSFFDSHEYFYVYTPEARYTYRVFASYVFDDRHLLSTIDIRTPELYEAYLTDIREEYSKNGFFREDVELTSESRVLTLSTCVGGSPQNRCLLQAVLTKIQPAA